MSLSDDNDDGDDDDDNDDGGGGDGECEYMCGYAYRQPQSRAAERSDSPMLQQRRPLSCEVPCDGVVVADDLSTADNQQLNGDTSATGDQKPASVLPLGHSSTVEPLIVHAGAVVSMLHLLPSIACQQQLQVGDWN